MSGFRDWSDDIIYMIYWVGDSRVFSLRCAGKVNLSLFIYNNVLKKCVTPDSPVYVRFILLAQINCLCLTPSLEVEDSLIIPAVLVVTYERPLGISGEGCLACAGQAEKDGYIVFLPYVG
mgnify:CR=1 FL=1